VRSLAVQLGPEGIRANAICPGATDTPALRRDIEDGTVRASLEQIATHNPMRRLGTVDDVAQTALFLASDASAYLTGLAIPIDGGATA
jgi:3-oxoacyl-[acyl-carrier protein] reductase